tara:strand:- start:312 stop:632 length:321 start_codon:yes stop_codon:yes gene_type:complete
MITYMRTITELMLITESRDHKKELCNKDEVAKIKEDNTQRKRYLRSKADNKIGLPDLPQRTNRNWIKSKKVVSKILDELDYNNQIQSSYDLTLIGRQDYNDHTDAA